MIRHATLAGVLGALFLVAPAHALTVNPITTAEFSFEGAGCGSKSGTIVTLPRGARSVQILDPDVGAVLASDTDDVTPVAQITAASVGTLGSRVVAGFEATGSDDVCTNPGNYPEGWATVDVDLRISYVRNVRTWVRDFGSGISKRRPRSLNLDVVRLTRLSWRSWDGRTARGRGRGARQLPVAVRLSRPRECGNGQWRYLTAFFRYTAAVPQGARRFRTIRLDSTCR